MKLRLLMLMIWFPICFVSGQRFLKTKGENIVDEKGQPVLLRGLTLEGWIQEPLADNGTSPYKVRQQLVSLLGTSKAEMFYSQWRNSFIRDIDISSMGVWGFNCVVLPVEYSFFSSAEAFKITDELLDWCSRSKLFLIISIRPEESSGNHAARDKVKQQMLDMWQVLAERYRDSEDLAGYCVESINFPTQNPSLNSADIVAAIRNKDNNHLLILEECNVTSGPANIFSQFQNMLFGFHLSPDLNADSVLSAVKEATTYYQVPGMLVAAPAVSNVWATDVIRKVEGLRMSWAPWPLKTMSGASPLEIKMNSDYQQLLKDSSAKFSGKDVDKILSTLLGEVKNENCLFHKEVTDAMFRQVYSTTARPFHEEVFFGDFRIPAADYDLGGNGIAYHDRDKPDSAYGNRSQYHCWNRGMASRNDGVDITHGKKSAFITDFEEGEWVQYTFFLESDAVYTLSLTVSSTKDSDHKRPKIIVIINGEEIKSNLTVRNTGDEENWTTAEIKNVNLQRDMNVVRVLAKHGSFNLRDLTFIQSGKNFANR
jgi:endoglucanase